MPFQLIYQEADLEGHYILLQGHLNGENIVLLNTYEPNTDDAQFYPRDLVNPVLDQPIVWAGDFNCIEDGTLDRHPPKMNTKPRMIH